MIPQIDQKSFAAVQAEGALVVDVRDAHEYRSGHVPGARLVPLSLLPLKLSELPKDQSVYVICQSGGRSAQATELMRSVGVDAYSVQGGTSAWMDEGRTVEAGTTGSAR